MSGGDFFAMGGYGLYVWGSYGVTLLFMVVEVILLLGRKRTLLQRLGRMNRANSAGRVPEVTAAARTGEVKNEIQT